MGSTTKDSRRGRIVDKAFGNPQEEAEALQRVFDDMDALQALVSAKAAENEANGIPFVAPRPLFSVKDHLEQIVKDAVCAGAIYYDADSGNPCVRLAQQSSLPAIGEPGWGTPEWDAEWNRQCAVRTHERDLEFALGDPRLSALALLWLDAPVVEVGTLVWMSVGSLAEDFGRVVHGVRGVPAPVLARVRKALPKFAPIHSSQTFDDGTRVELWENALVLAVRMAATMHDKVPRARERVQLVLESLEELAGAEMPAAVAKKFSEPSEVQIVKATNLMEGLRLAGIRRDALPPLARKGGGKPKDPWGAARDFARCFEVQFVDKPSRLKRRK